MSLPAWSNATDPSTEQQSPATAAILNWRLAEVVEGLTAAGFSLLPTSVRRPGCSLRIQLGQMDPGSGQETLALFHLHVQRQQLHLLGPLQSRAETARTSGPSTPFRAARADSNLVTRSWAAVTFTEGSPNGRMPDVFATGGLGFGCWRDWPWSAN